MSWDNKPRKPLQRKTPMARGTKPLAQGKPLQRKTPLSSTPPARMAQGTEMKRGAPLARTAPTSGASETQRSEPPKRMRQQSAKRAALMPERRRIVATIMAIQPECVVPSCSRPACDGHERKTRGRGGSIVNPYNVVGLCRPCHDEVTGEADWAYPLGLLLHSWDAEPTTPLELLSPMQQQALIRVATDAWYPKTPFDVEQWWAQQQA